MRLTAVIANLCFIVYGWLGPFYPVLILHTILLPVNSIRLRELARGSRRPPKLNTATPMPLLDQWRSALTLVPRRELRLTARSYATSEGGGAE
jgi:hypothetical protein